jgi:hypothetical protein
MEKKCLWLEFEEVKNEVEELKQEKRRCKEAIDVSISSAVVRISAAGS